ncbi:MAG: PucR family transcriptional regulator, partial [Nocardioidaceae bacterium]
ELFGGLAMVTTADGRVLSRAGATTWWDRLCVSSLFHPSGRFRTEASGPGLHAVDDLPGSHAVVTVTGGRVDHGRLVLFHDQQRLTGEDLTVLERAGDVAAICLAKELAVSAVESKYRGDFLRDVLAGRAGDQAEVLAHARSLGWDLDRPLVVVAAALETEDGPPRTRGFQRPLEVERFSAAWSTVVAGDDPSIAVVGFASEVVALLPVLQAGEQAGSERDVVAAVIAAVRGDGGGGRRRFAAGVSRVTSTLTDLPAAYEQARKTLHAGRRLHGPETVAHFDDLGVFRLLSLIEDDAELDRFVAETLRGLAADPEHGSGETAGLRETLQVLLDTNLNVAETARTLHFHYNTLRYRIGKIERMVGPFTADPNLRLDLALALRIVAMRTL